MHNPPLPGLLGALGGIGGLGPMVPPPIQQEMPGAHSAATGGTTQSQPKEECKLTINSSIYYFECLLIRYFIGFKYSFQSIINDLDRIKNYLLSLMSLFLSIKLDENITFLSIFRLILFIS